MLESISTSDCVSYSAALRVWGFKHGVWAEIWFRLMSGHKQIDANGDSDT